MHNHDAGRRAEHRRLAASTGVNAAPCRPTTETLVAHDASAAQPPAATAPRWPDSSRALFDAIDEGFCVVEVLFDADGRAHDYRFLEANPAFARHTGLIDAVGRTARELVPGLEEHWFEHYGRVAATGEPARFVDDAQPMGGRTFDVVAFRVGDPAARQVGILFTDVTERRRIDAALRRSEERSRAILASITDAFFSLDRDWRFDYLNRQAERLLGRSPGDLLGRVVWDEYPGLLGSAFERAYRDAADAGVASSVTAFYPDHDRWYEVRAYPAPEGVTVYFRDVSDQVRADAALRASEERYRTLFASIDEGFAVIAPQFDERGEPVDYLFLEANPAFQRQSGLADPVGKTARELAPGHEEHWIRTYGRVATTGEPVRFVQHAPSVGGRWFEVFAFRVGDPAARRVAILFSDVTARRTAEDALRASEERLRLALDAAGMGVYAWDPATDRTDADDRLREMIGLRADEEFSLATALGRNIHPDDRDRYAAAAAAMVDPAGPGRLREEVRWIGSDGTERWLAFAGQATFAGEGAERRVVSAVGGVLDVTARRELERQKDEFVAVATHELRTPVTSIKGYAQLLRNRFRRAGDEQAAAFMETLDAQIDRLSDLVGDLVEATRVGAGQLRLAPAPFALDDLVDESVAELQITTESHLIRREGRAGVTVVADRDRIGQVLANLLANAIKYSPAGGEVVVSAVAGDDVTICVRDSGIGIPPHELPRVFDRFYRIEGGQHATPPGLGLGLYISAEIVRRHGGRIWAESAEGEGTTVCFRLPLAPA
jgi:PAS domain S-box-containing protein